MIENPEAAARDAANLLMVTRFADQVEQRNAIVRVLLQFHDAGTSASLSRIERLEGLLRRIKPWLHLDAFADLRREIDEVLRHD